MNLIETENSPVSAATCGETQVLEVFPGEVTSKISAIVATIARRHDVTRDIAPHEHLVDSGMTSMAMVDLMLAIEAELDVMIPQREMTPLNFQSINSLAQMLQRVTKA